MPDVFSITLTLADEIFLDLFILFCVYDLPAYMSVEVRRGHQISWNQLEVVVSHHVRVGNEQVLCESKCPNSVSALFTNTGSHWAWTRWVRITGHELQEPSGIPCPQCADITFLCHNASFPHGCWGPKLRLSCVQDRSLMIEPFPKLSFSNLKKKCTFVVLGLNPELHACYVWTWVQVVFPNPNFSLCWWRCHEFSLMGICSLVNVVLQCCF